MKEDILQQQIISLLSLYSARHNFIFFAPMNEAVMMVLTKFRIPQKTIYMIMSWLRKMGFLPGVSDIIIGHQGKMYCMELKTDIGKQSKVQILFEKNCKKTFIDYRVVRSVRQCEDCLHEWGVI